ncbi:YdeI/OmpD-associated family protein [Phenylobacterium sp.]|uniref:YdeI/OmpD-associated family protein n=1 Tax=Phenylobacterium sp. TaxID=1871053 RepID=UPI002DECF6D5|nr:YdeI/OmpD-associated family protein [Phenylobacterium sp.]
MAPVFFATPADWRAWLADHHASAAELSVGFQKVGSGKPSINWPQSVDEALCFGWIDGVRHRIDDEAYRIRFTPRKPGSVWSRVNLKRFAELKDQGRVAPAGQAAFDARRASTYSYESQAGELTPEESARFAANAAAWATFRAAPPGYRRIVLHWIASAKRPETRARRLDQLIDVSAAGRRIDFMKPASTR